MIRFGSYNLKQGAEVGYNGNSLIKKVKRQKVHLLLLLPFIAYIAIFKYIPMYGALLAFRHFSFRTPFGGDWVGFTYFKAFFNNPDFFVVIRNTIVISALNLVFSTIAAINMSIAMRMLRFPLMGLAASFGMFGIFLGLMLLILHSSSLKSFGVPYLAPFSPFIPDDLKDTLIRKPLWLMNTRPRLLSRQNVYRQSKKSPPPAKSK